MIFPLRFTTLEKKGPGGESEQSPSTQKGDKSVHAQGSRMGKSLARETRSLEKDCLLNLCLCKNRVKLPSGIHHDNCQSCTFGEVLIFTKHQRKGRQAKNRGCEGEFKDFSFKPADLVF